MASECSYDWSIRVMNGPNRADAALRLVYKPVMNRVQRQFEAVGDAELVKNIVQMVFYRLFGDEKFFADFLVPEALCNKLNDLFLSVAEQRLFAAWACLRSEERRVGEEWRSRWSPDH